MLIRLFQTLFITLLLSPAVYASPSFTSWHLPKKLSDDNTTVSFKVDSTWHMVTGKTSDISGYAKLNEPEDPSSLEVNIKIPVNSFDTDNSSRDERLREVMFENDYPNVSFKGIGLSNQCTPALVIRDGTCKDYIHGMLTITKVKKDVKLPVTISKHNDSSFKVTGSLTIDWKEFGVEDPSIFVARLDPTVNIAFEVILKPSKYNN